MRAEAQGGAEIEMTMQARGALSGASLFIMGEVLPLRSAIVFFPRAEPVARRSDDAHFRILRERHARRFNNQHARKAGTSIGTAIFFPTAQRHRSFRRRNAKPLAVNHGFRFSCRVVSGGPHMRRRTSYVLFNRASCRMPAYTTRLQGGVAPVDPDQGGASPSVGYSPDIPRCAEVVA